ncbi:MAG: outer membrane lipoprotein chaperone LolA [Alcaligenaceae bacterium]|nr:outer membrane lipoprotein chaperone LolA [Alcaligenaceae bacterium]
MMIKTAAKWLAVGMMAVACAPALAAGAHAQLQRFVADVQSATGRFTQQVADDQGQQRQAQQGEFAFQRPGRFRWETLQPYEQLVVSDGQVLRQYDPDLAQVTEKPVDASIGASPAAILFGSGSLEEAFELVPQDDRDGLSWLRARPRSGDAGFTHVDIGFAEGMPRRLELLDAFGQTTRIELADIVPNPSLPADAFAFDVPADVDVVRVQ